MAKASVLWLSQPRASQTEAVVIREEFTACKWRRKMLTFFSNTWR